MDPRQRTPRTVARDRRRERALDWEATRRPAWVMWLSVACVVLLLVAVVALANSDRRAKPTAVNGDVLGPDRETVAEYTRRARGELDAMTGDEARWALVTPATAQGPDGLAQLFGDLADVRVSTLLVGPNARETLPEPARGARRIDVFTAARDTLAVEAGTEPTDPALDAEGVLVHARPDALREIARRGVRAVEPLPPDAVYGRFALRSVAVATDRVPGA
ncbi:hypothetical protein QDW14_05485 [Corynebacterium bovis]|uniref:hypothetical protein n=1 Tax=Corynebacterium bovis TaxID=36808 RepID=UPI00244CD5D2|nr:hypothetical protein [Corynebacterium bovis]MDH2455929.1 hypothetical protein [Corynebacterium bovis]